jgi:Fe-S cluster assembly ATPase SufC
MNNGMTPNILKAIMGHSSLKTTEGYIGFDIESMREQMKKVTIKEEVPKGKEVEKNVAQGLAKNE